MWVKVGGVAECWGGGEREGRGGDGERPPGFKAGSHEFLEGGRHLDEATVVAVGVQALEDADSVVGEELDRAALVLDVGDGTRVPGLVTGCHLDERKLAEAIDRALDALVRIGCLVVFLVFPFGRVLLAGGGRKELERSIREALDVESCEILEHVLVILRPDARQSPAAGRDQNRARLPVAHLLGGQRAVVSGRRVVWAGRQLRFDASGRAIASITASYSLQRGHTWWIFSVDTKPHPSASSSVPQSPHSALFVRSASPVTASSEDTPRSSFLHPPEAPCTLPSGSTFPRHCFSRAAVPASRVSWRQAVRAVV